MVKVAGSIKDTIMYYTGWAITTNGAGTWGPAMRTGNTPKVVVVTLQ